MELYKRCVNLSFQFAYFTIHLFPLFFSLFIFDVRVAQLHSVNKLLQIALILNLNFNAMDEFMLHLYSGEYLLRMEWDIKNISTKFNYLYLPVERPILSVFQATVVCP